MTDKPIQHMDKDGTRYSVEITPPEGDEYRAKYHVDLVRTSVTDDGLGREQRLTIGQYSSWMEAEEHQHEIEDDLAEHGLDLLGADVQRLREQPFESDVFYLTAVYPPDAIDGNQQAHAHRLAIGEDQITPTFLGAGERDTLATTIEGIDSAGMSGIVQSMPEPETVRHVDDGGTTHWFAVVPNDEPDTEPYELRYFRLLTMEDGSQRDDSYPVMPLPDDQPDPWALHGLEMYLLKGDIFMAQQFAHDVSANAGGNFPAPLDIPALDPQPHYYFGYSVGENNRPSLEAVKTWMDGTERRFDTLTINEYDSYEEAALDEYILDTTLTTDGVEAAMNLAELWALADGYLDPNRLDARIFFEDDAPDDPFQTHREREMPRYTISAISANGESFIDVTKTWEDENSQRLVIPQPSWDEARDSAMQATALQEAGDLVGAMRQMEILAEEVGVLDSERMDGRLFTHGPPDLFMTIREQELNEELIFDEEWAASRPVVNEASREAMQKMDERREANATLEGTAWFEATFGPSRQLLQPLDDTVNYAVILHGIDPFTTELAVEKYWKKPDGDFGRDVVALQTYSNDDEQANDDHAFLLEVYAEDGLEAMMQEAEIIAVENKYLSAERDDPRLFTRGPLDLFTTMYEEAINDRLAQHGVTWREAHEWSQDQSPQPQSEATHPHWRLETLPVNDPDGEPLGHALHLVVYPNVEHDPEYVGTTALAEDEPFRMLEMAHFETLQAADQFSKKFNSYLIPDLLEAPELAVEVARLEGLPVEWKTLEGDDLKAYQDVNLTLTRDRADWHPYNPNAERDARMEAEGMYYDPIQSVMEGNREDDAKVEPVSPDFDF